MWWLLVPPVIWTANYFYRKNRLRSEWVALAEQISKGTVRFDIALAQPSDTATLRDLLEYIEDLNKLSDYANLFQKRNLVESANLILKKRQDIISVSWPLMLGK